MEPRSITLLVIIGFCVIMSAYFSATETAFSTFNRIRMKTMAENGNKRAERVLKLADNYDTLISTILIGNNIVNILASSLATMFFVGLLTTEQGSNENLATTLSTIVMTVVVLIFGEVCPKTVAKEMPEKFCMFAAPFINLLVYVFLPLNFLFKQLKKLLKIIFKSDEETGITEEELITIIEEAEEDGNFDKSETDLIRSAIEFNDLEVADIFTPRIDITAIDASSTREEIKALFIESGYSRLPVYEDDLDNINGILYYKDFFSKEFKDISEIKKPVMFITKNKNVNELMKELQEKKLHMAVVTDEYGSTAGIVTLEDILEEIVGDIWDEHDDVIIEVREVAEGEYIVNGKANISKVFDEIGIDVEPDALTVNGWVIDVLARIPCVGDTFRADGLVATVLKMNGRRLENLKLRKLTEEELAEEEEESKESKKNS